MCEGQAVSEPYIHHVSSLTTAVISVVWYFPDKGEHATLYKITQTYYSISQTTHMEPNRNNSAGVVELSNERREFKISCGTVCRGESLTQFARHWGAECD